MRLLFIALLLFSVGSYGSCWKVGEFKGYSAKAGDSYKISSDGLSGKIFNVQFAGKGSAVIPSQDMQCTQIAENSIICLFSEEGRGTVEAWSVDPKSGAAYYTKSLSGFGMFDGPTMFTGKIKGTCQ